MVRLVGFLLCVFLAARAAPPPAVKALLLGNGAYRFLPALPASPGSAARIAGAIAARELKGVASDVDAAALAAAIDRFIEDLKEGDDALVFFSGYAVGEQNENYLLPVDYNPAAGTGIGLHAYSVSRLLAQMEERNVRLRILLLDAAVPTGFSLAPMPDPGGGTQVLVSTHPGEFLEALAVTLANSRIPLAELAREARQAVSRPPEPLLAGPFENPKDHQRYVWIPAGTFLMGCAPKDDPSCQPDEQPKHAVHLSRGFWMGETEVTASGYLRFANAFQAKLPVPSRTNPNWKDGGQPIMRVTWKEAQNYCEWAGGRLPTEAEWEHAARGGLRDTLYPWAGELTRKKANYQGAEGPDRWEDTAPVRSFDPNPRGLDDMAGNVWEWCLDFYDGSYYGRSPALDPKGPAAGREHVIRGGSWNSLPKHLRVSVRERDASQGNHIGFRCVLEKRP